jgi:hypothetical protein
MSRFNAEFYESQTLEVSFCGFRESALYPWGEFYNSFTCRYVNGFPSSASENSRLCGDFGTHDGHRFIPACEQHREFYEMLINQRIHVTPQNTCSQVKKQLHNIPKAIEISNECCVCYTKENKLLIGCLHVICYSCYSSLQNISCPQCREPIDNKCLHRL